MCEGGKPRDTRVHVLSLIQQSVLWRERTQDECLGVHARGHAVWRGRGLSRENILKIPVRKGSQAEGAASAGKERRGVLSRLRATVVSSWTQRVRTEVG